MSAPSTTPARITSWDRAAIVALGAAGCALSYDALQQMATAIHIRGFLTFVFPLVIDGFIAYGVRGLLVLRTAPLAARCYVWFLFGIATVASIWANALHAVRLNQQQPEGPGLRLGDITVGVLSTLAPLALAGAVHLYILIARRVTEIGAAEAPDTPGAHQGDRPEAGKSPDTGELSTADVLSGQPEVEDPEPADRPDAEGGELPPRPRQVTRLHVASSRSATPEAFRTQRQDTSDRKATQVTDEDLLAIARPAVTEAGRLTRKVVADAIRSHDLGLGNARLTELMRLLRKEAGQPDNARVG
ncbi:DUF2637 domain-containing protein [Streptomyces sp. LHD-70]|uniref:DUF2637 domain-containing protein n=1 Tax=Streptomyces sp. LHD-70 TaxID=3072140 RepID=UPI00280D4B52|nr:DUF2637 domain-containing protein [Streptomyces sp. LHD-70]MDQ8708243.1 DUF2637 domain-containing protein [Streptomyces sp. LHD-70]